MARLTVEDCEPFVSNRFDLVIMAATRSRDIMSGAPISVERDGDKTSVIALREIAAQSIDTDHINEMAIQQFQNARHQIMEEDTASTSKDDSFSAEEGDTITAPEYSALEQQSLESGFDSIAEILDGDLDETPEADNSE